jgi:hypothetical protein
VTFENNNSAMSTDHQLTVTSMNENNTQIANVAGKLIPIEE